MGDIHDYFQHPSSESVIWRYRNFSDFVSMISNSSLHFTSAYNLDDRLEGKLPRIAREKWLQHGDVGERFLKQYERSLHCFHVNCWTIRDDEDRDMWDYFGRDQFGQSDRAIVIKSTVGRLVKSFVQLSEDADWANGRVWFGVVRYIDYSGTTDFDDMYEYYRSYEKISTTTGLCWFDIALQDISADLILEPFPILPPILFVDSAYAWEQELRVITVPYSTETLAEADADDGGSDSKVDLSKLIESIRVSPRADPSFITEVKEVMDKYNLNVPLEP